MAHLVARNGGEDPHRESRRSTKAAYPLVARERDRGAGDDEEEGVQPQPSFGRTRERRGEGRERAKPIVGARFQGVSSIARVRSRRRLSRREDGREART